jgi:fluoride exporter
MTAWLTWTGVALLGAAGAWARYTLGTAVAARRPGPFPLGTFTVTLTGAFLLGALTGASLTGDALLLLGTGLLGAYTTFSTWMVEAQRLAEDGALRTMWLYLLGSLVAGLAATSAGWLLGEVLR